MMINLSREMVNALLSIIAVAKNKELSLPEPQDVEDAKSMLLDMLQVMRETGEN